ncbi:hypothetical protein A2U01_0015870, partial [Trifolium medium]|nr:hypothetical protein [Trifolium medium]
VTSTEMAHSITFAYMMSEKEDNIIMALESALLCTYDISKNVKARCKVNCKVKDLKSKDGKEMKPTG